MAYLNKKIPLKTERVTVRMTPRQHKALVAIAKKLNYKYVSSVLYRALTDFLGAHSK